MIEKKIAIGTANFGASYGLVSKSFVNENKINEILSFCKKNFIDTIDTAQDYKKSEVLLGKYNCGHFKVITKMAKFNNVNVKNPNSFFKKKLFCSLNNLNQENIYGLLFRDPISLISRDNIAIWNEAKKYKKEGLINKVGITIYSPGELVKTFNILEPDIVQFPYNIFDRRIELSGWIEIFKKKKVEMHCRSIFLQGLLLKNKNELPKKFIEYSKTWDSYHEWLRDNNLSPEEACINFILKKKEISKIIIGIDNLEQLKKILITRQKSNYSLFANNNIDQKLIDPRKW